MENLFYTSPYTDNSPVKVSYRADDEARKKFNACADNIDAVKTRYANNELARQANIANAICALSPELEEMMNISPDAAFAAFFGLEESKSLDKMETALKRIRVATKESRDALAEFMKLTPEEQDKRVREQSPNAKIPMTATGIYGVPMRYNGDNPNYDPEKEKEEYKRKLALKNTWENFVAMKNNFSPEVMQDAMRFMTAYDNRSDAAEAHIDKFLEKDQEYREEFVQAVFSLSPEIKAGFWKRVGTRIAESYGDTGRDMWDYFVGRKTEGSEVFALAQKMNLVDENGELTKDPENLKKLHAAYEENVRLNAGDLGWNSWSALGNTDVAKAFEKGKRENEFRKNFRELIKLGATRFSDKNGEWKTLEDAVVNGEYVLRSMALGFGVSAITRNPYMALAATSAMMYAQETSSMFADLYYEGGVNAITAARGSAMYGVLVSALEQWQVSKFGKFFAKGEPAVVESFKEYLKQGFKQGAKRFVQENIDETAVEMVQTSIDFAMKLWAAEHLDATYETHELIENYCAELKDVALTMPIITSTLYGAGAPFRARGYLRRVGADFGSAAKATYTPSYIIENNVRTRGIMDAAEEYKKLVEDKFGKTESGREWLDKYLDSTSEEERTNLLKERFTNDDERYEATLMLDALSKIDAQATREYIRNKVEVAKKVLDENEKILGGDETDISALDGMDENGNFAALEAAIDALGLRDDVVFADTAEDLAEASGLSIDSAEEIMANAGSRGFFNAKNGKIAVIRPHFKSGADALQVLAHEYGHKIMRKIKSENALGYGEMCDEILRLLGGDTIARKMLPAAYSDEKSPQYEGDPRAVAEEILMRVVERVATKKALDTAAKKSVWARFKSWFKKFFDEKSFAEMADDRLAQIAMDVLQNEKSFSVSLVGVPQTTPKTPSKQWTAKTPEADGAEVGGQWVVMDARDLKTSTDEGYDDNLQPRNRTRQASKEQSAKIAINLDPERLNDSQTTDLGAPIVDSRGMVVSGNGRTIAIRQAYEAENPEKGNAYRDFVRQRAAELGIEIPEGVKNPVLVRRVDNLGGMSLEEFAARSNKSQIAGMSIAEQAVADGRRIVENGLLDVFFPSADGNVLSSDNRDFVNAFLELVGGGELYRNKDGSIRTNLAPRIKAAVLAAMLGKDGNREIVERLLDNPEGFSALINGLMASAANLAELSQKEAYDISEELSQAVELYVEMRGKGQTLAEFIAQDDMFRPKPSDEVLFLMKLFEDNAKTSSGISGVLKEYAAQCRKIDTATANLFGEDDPAKLEKLQSAYNHYATDVAETDAGAENKWSVIATPKYDEFRKELHRVMKLEQGNMLNALIKVGETPDILKMLGYENLPLLLSGSVVWKVAFDPTKERFITEETLGKIGEAIEDPLFIEKSASNSSQPNNSILIHTELEHNGEKLAVVIHLSKEKDGYAIHNIASVYARSQSQKDRVLDESRLLYLNTEKGLSEFNSELSLQSIHPENLKNLFVGGKVFTQDDLSQYKKSKNLKFSFAGEQAPSDAELEEARKQKAEVKAKWTNPDGTMKKGYHCAPNGKPSKLTEDQWLLVRTPNFKRWFGDWEKQAYAYAAMDFLEKTEAVAKLTGKEFQKDGVKLTEKVPAYFESIGGIAHNEELGDVILDLESVKDSIAHGVGSLKAAAFMAVKDVIEKGYIFNRESNWKNRGYDTAVIVAPISIDNIPYTCEVVVKKGDRGNAFYLHEVEIKKTLEDMFKTTTKGAISQASRLILGKHLAEVKKNVSKVVDENGEPLVVYHGTRATSRFNVFEGSEHFFSDNKEVADGFLAGNDFVLEINGDKYPVSRRDLEYLADAIYGDAANFEYLLGDFEAGELSYGSVREMISDITHNEYTVEALEDFPLSIKEGGRIVEAFLNIRNPVEIDYGGETWQAGKVMPEQDLQDNPQADGLIGRNIREGGLLGELRNGEDFPLSTDYVVRDSNQIKDANENVGTFSERNDIRWSIAGEGNLIVSHNISQANLIKAARLGGLPMPSLAVRRTDIESEKYTFGDISLIAPKHILSDRAANTYQGDMWSPVYPQRKFVVPEKEQRRVIELLRKRYEKAGIEFNETPIYQDFYNHYFPEDIVHDLGDLHEAEVGEGLTMVSPDWQEKMLNYLDIKGEPKLFAGYTYMGRPQFVPETLENAVKLMKKRSLRGDAGPFSGTSSLKSTLIKKLNLKQVSKNRDAIKDKETVEAERKKFIDERGAIIQELEKVGKYLEKYKSENPFTVLDRHATHIQEMAEEGIEPINRDFYDGKIPEELKEKISDFFKRLANSSVPYFESKIKRAMKLDEFSGAVIPEMASMQVRQILEQNNIPYREYKNESERGRIIEEFTRELDAGSGDIRWSVSDLREKNDAETLKNLSAEEIYDRIKSALPEKFPVARLEEKSNLKYYWDWFKENLLNKEIETAIRRKAVFKEGHFLKLIAGGKNKGFIKGYSEWSSAKQAIENGKVLLDNEETAPEGFSMARARQMPLVLDVLQNPQFVLKDKKLKDFLFIKKYDGGNSWVAVMFNSSDMGIISWHTRDFTMSNIRRSELIYQKNGIDFLAQPRKSSMEENSSINGYLQSQNSSESQEENSTYLKSLLRQERGENPVIWASIVLAREILLGKPITNAKIEKLLPSGKFDGTQRQYAADRAKTIAEHCKATQENYRERIDQAVQLAEVDVYWNKDVMREMYNSFRKDGEEYGIVKQKLVQWLKDERRKDLDNVKGLTSSELGIDVSNAIENALEAEPQRKPAEEKPEAETEETDGEAIEGVDDELLGAREQLAPSNIRDIISKVRTAITKKVKASGGDEQTRRRIYRNTLVNVLREAAQNLTYGREREAILAKISELASKGYAIIKIKDGDRAGQEIDNYTLRAEHVALRIFNRGVRDTKAQLVERMNAALKRAKPPRGVEREDKRKMAAAAERRFNRIKKAVAMSATELEEAVKNLTNEINAIDDMGDAKKNNYAEYRADVFEQLAVINKFGGFKDKSRGEMAELVEEVENGYDAEIEAQEKRVEEQKRKADERRQIFIDAIEMSTRNPSDESAARRMLRGLVNSGYLYQHRLEDLCRYATGDKRKAADKYIADLTNRIYRAAAEKENEIYFTREKLLSFIEETYGESAEKVLAALLEKRDDFRKFSNGKKPQKLSKSQILQLIAVAEQSDYTLNVALHRAKTEAVSRLHKQLAEIESDMNLIEDKRSDEYKEKRAEKERAEKELKDACKDSVKKYVEELKQVLDKNDLKLLDWLRQYYADTRSELSAVNKRITGLEILPRDLEGMYMPVSVDNSGGFGEDVNIVPIVPKSMTPRVPHTRDINEDLGVLDIFDSRLQENATYKHFADLHIELRGIFAHADFHRAVKENLGADVLKQLLDHTNDIIAVRPANQHIIPLLDKFTNWHACSALGFNLGVGLRQLTSIPAFAMYLDDRVWKYAAQGFGGLAALGAEKLGIDIGNAEVKQAIRDILTHPITQRRLRIGNSQVLQEMLGALDSGRFMKWWRRHAMVFNKLGDITPMLTVGQGIYRTGIDGYLARGYTLEAAKEAAINDFWKIAEMSQQSGLAMNSAAWQRRGGSFGRAFGQYTSTVNQFLSKEIIDLKRALATGDKDDIKRAAKTVIINHAILAGGYTLATIMYKAMLGDDWDDDDWWSLMASAATGPLGGLIVFGRFTSALSGGAANFVPFSSFWRVAKDFGLLVVDMATLDFADAMKDADRIAKNLAAPWRDLRKAWDNYVEN